MCCAPGEATRGHNRVRDALLAVLCNGTLDRQRSINHPFGFGAQLNHQLATALRYVAEGLSIDSGRFYLADSPHGRTVNRTRCLRRGIDCLFEPLMSSCPNPSGAALQAAWKLLQPVLQNLERNRSYLLQGRRLSQQSPVEHPASKARCPRQVLGQLLWPS